jgi:hypothetical protein
VLTVQLGRHWWSGPGEVDTLPDRLLSMLSDRLLSTLPDRLLSTLSEWLCRAPVHVRSVAGTPLTIGQVRPVQSAL